MTRLLLWMLGLAVWLPAQGPSARGGDSPSNLTLERDVQPLLKARCIKCHGPIKPKGKLNLSGPRSLARGGDSGPAVEPGSPDDSTLWERVASGEMPPKSEEPLSPDEQRLIRLWIEQGARGMPRPEDVPETTGPGSDHWAFATLTDVAVPPVRDLGAARTPVDRFIIAPLETHGITVGPEADRATLIRRLSFDLIGLPPTPEATAAFVSDTRPDAYERLVESLLASPHYGERWGKFWLDAMGYTESNGYFSADSERPLAYRYRDYVIEAFNADRPLDQIIREQLAGDELSGYRPGVEITRGMIDQLVATHYLRNGQDGTGESDGNPEEVKIDKVFVLDAAVQIIGSSLLGLTLQCAKCHDHKFEPITQKEYYQFHAILAPAFNLEKWVKPNDRKVEAAPRFQAGPWEAHEKALDVQAARLKQALGPGPNDPPKEKQTRQEALDNALKALNAGRRPHPGQIAWVTDLGPEPVGAALLIRGNPSTPGAPVQPGVPSFLAERNNPFEVAPPSGSPPRTTGRRLALARWLTRDGSRAAALLARVQANRIWQHHFGAGLAATSDNIGFTGSPPTHPELLEFLAAELVRTGWSSKALHRLIVGSAAWRQSSAPRPEVESIDPDHRLLARFPLRRLDAEAMRDAMLAVSGELDTIMNGPSVPTRETPGGEVVPVSDKQGGLRRSVYLKQRRTQLASLLEVFDAPSIVATCTRRLPATIPLQSLSLMNSEFVVSRAGRLARRLGRECAAGCCAEAGSLVARAFVLSTGRPPDDHEREVAELFLESQPARYPQLSPAEAAERSLADLCQMILASNAFLYVE